MKEKATIAKGSAWILTGQMLTKLISFIYTVIIAHLLSLDEIGTFYFVLSVLGILYIFTDLGLIYSLSRYVPYLHGKKEFSKLHNLVKLSYFGGGILTLIFSIIIFIFSGEIANILEQPAAGPILQMLAIWLFIKEIDDVNRGIINGRKKVDQIQFLNIFQNFSKLAITLIAVYMVGFNAYALSWGYLISFILVVPLGLYLVFIEKRKWEKSTEKNGILENIALGKEILSFGLIVTIVSLFWTIIQYTDKVMIGYFSPESAAGIAIYTMALGLANLILIFPSSLNGIFFPVVSELYGKKEIKEMNKTTATSIKWLFMLMVPAIIILGLFGKELLGLFYGVEYEAGALVLALFVFGLFIKSIFVLPSTVLSAMRKLDVELKAAGIASIFNIVLNILFIPLWGINGAAAASAISFIVLSLMVWYYSRKIFGFRFPKGIYKILIAAFFGIIILFLLKGNIVELMNSGLEMVKIGESQGQMADEILQKIAKLAIFCILVVISTVIYFAGLLFLGAFEKEETEILELVLKKAKIPENYRMKILRIFTK